MNYNKTGKRIIVPLAIAACLSAGLTGCGKKSTEEHLEAAKQFANANNSDAAIIEFKNAIKSNPKAMNIYETGFRNGLVLPFK